MEKKLRVLLVTSSYPLEDKYTRNGVMYVAEELVNQGVEVGVLVKSLTTSFRETTQNGVTIYQYPYTFFRPPILHTKLDLLVAVKSSLSAKLQLFGYTINSIKYIIKVGRKYDLIHAFWFIPSGFFLAMANKFRKKPSLLTSFGSDLHSLPNNFLINKVLRFNGKNFTHMSAISNYLRERAKLHGIDYEKIRIIPALTRVDDFNIERVKNDKMIIGTAARLIPLKRVRDLIDAISGLQEKNITQDYEVRIIGEGPEKDDLIDRVKKNNIENIVKFIGYPKDWPEQLAQIDIFVHNSEREGLSTVNIEAMAAGCTVVTTDGHSNEELIDDGVDGFLYQNRNTEHLEEILLKLVKDPDLVASAGEKAKKKAQKYDVANVVNQYRELYKEIIDTN